MIEFPTPTELTSINDQGFLTDDEHEFPLDIDAEMGMEFDGRPAFKGGITTQQEALLTQTMRERLFEGWSDHTIEVYTHDDIAPPRTFSPDPAAELEQRFADMVRPLDAHVRKCHRMFSATPRLVKSVSPR